MKIHAAYIRVSTLDQNTDLQEKAIKEYSSAKGIDLKIFRDKFTGTTMDRPAWQRLQSLIDGGKVQSLVVWKLDRLGRTAAGLTTLFASLINQKVKFISLTEGIDLSTSMGKLMATVLSAVAEYETEVRRERTVAGLKTAKAKGVKLGGYAKGWTKLNAKQLEVVKDLHMAGQSSATIAKAVGITVPTVNSLKKKLISGQPLPTPRKS
ncbi:MAG: recombinase family protein [Planctomycetes bacterium]|nr:recombinase family protein [Planctomycetota bacterium]